MVRSTLGTITVRTSAETKDWFKNSFEVSSSNSQGEFLEKLLERWNNEAPAPEPEIVTVNIERDRDLQQDEILLCLKPAQLFALRETVLTPGFAEKQNTIIESLKGDRPWMNFSRLYEPEFLNLWTRNIVMTKTMTEAEKENAVRHNITAFLVNMFLVHIIEGNISPSMVNADNLKAFIIKTTPKKEIAPNQPTPPPAPTNF